MFALHSPGLKMVQHVGRKILLFWINNSTVETANNILSCGLFGGSVEGKKHFIFYCMLYLCWELAPVGSLWYGASQVQTASHKVDHGRLPCLPTGLPYTVIVFSLWSDPNFLNTISQPIITAIAMWPCFCFIKGYHGEWNYLSKAYWHIE